MGQRNEFLHQNIQCVRTKETKMFFTKLGRIWWKTFASFCGKFFTGDYVPKFIRSARVC